jgi:hypothetical protein
VYQSDAAFTMTTFIGETTLPADGSLPRGEFLCSVTSLGRCVEDISVFTSAPEPASLALMTVPLAMLGVVRSRAGRAVPSARRRAAAGPPLGSRPG